MITRLAAVAVAVLVLTGCTTITTEPVPPSSREATPTDGSKPTPSLTSGGIPEGFTASVERSFPDADPADIYTVSQFYCLSLDNIEGDQDEAGRLLLEESQWPIDQALAIMRMSPEYVCPEWRDAYDAWVTSGGPKRL